MTQKTSINEKALFYHIECPLRSDGSNYGPESPVLQCAERTDQWLIAEIAAGRQRPQTSWLNMQPSFYD
jgi:hypothetical protein